MEKGEIMQDKYNLERAHNIYLAKKLMADTIYCGLKMEGSRMTFPETQTILDGVNVPNATLDDIQAILNMRDAWKYVFTTIDEPFTLKYACEINSFVARNESLEWGVLRTGEVGISGTTYVPAIPDEEQVEGEMEHIFNSTKSITQKAIEYMLWGARSQLFWDGNKRTSLICANKILIKEGRGILTIPEKEIATFNKLLTAFYETNNNTKIVDFLYKTSIRGIDFKKDLKADERKKNKSR